MCVCVKHTLIALMRPLYLKKFGGFLVDLIQAQELHGPLFKTIFGHFYVLNQRDLTGN